MQYPAIQRECAKEDLLHSLGRRDHCPRNHITMTADVLGGRVHDYVHAVRDRLLKERRSPAIVDARQCAVLAGDVGDRTDVERAEHHRPGIFEPDHPRIRT